MKSCPYCGEVIEEGDTRCGDCGRELAAPGGGSGAGGEREVFLRALFFGLGCGVLVFAYRSFVPLREFTLHIIGRRGYAILGGISSALIFAFLWSLGNWLWRAVLRRHPGLRPFGLGSGFASTLVFLGLTGMFCLLLVYMNFIPG